jgi:tripartite ATP-independent transporter DctM subunit
MLIPPSVMLIIYAFVAEQSVGDMFLAGVFPGLLLSAAFIAAIFAMTFFARDFIGKGAFSSAAGAAPAMPLLSMANKLTPLILLILIVLGGIYAGVVTAAEAGAAGALVAFVIAAVKGRMSARAVKEVLVETGHITAAILFLIMSATMYSRMLGIAGLPSLFSDWLSQADLSFTVMMMLYVLLLLFLGTIIDTSSIILICAPLFLRTIEDMGLSLVWFGIVTVVGAEVGLLTPPFGISCFVIKQTLERTDITLNDVFFGAAPFALIMLGVLVLLILFPQISLAIL